MNPGSPFLQGRAERDSLLELNSKALGFTMLELVMAMTLLAATAALTLSNWGPISTRLEVNGFANKLQAGLQSARFEAIKRNRVVVFFWDDTQQTFQTVVKNPTNTGCDIDTGDEILSPIPLPDMNGLREALLVQGSFVTEHGIAWKANGLTASCSNFEGTGGNTLEVRFDGFRGARDIDIEISLGGGVSTSFLD